jgi:hypothetical protein
LLRRLGRDGGAPARLVVAHPTLGGSLAFFGGRSARGAIVSLERRRSIGRQQERLTMMKALFRVALGGVLLAALSAASHSAANAHEIYTGLHGRNGQLCCGGDDCASTVYRERGGTFEFLTREQRWIAIPQERITFLPIPGDPPSDESHHAHLCYRSATDFDRHGPSSASVFENIFLYCAFIPPGSI